MTNKERHALQMADLCIKAAKKITDQHRMKSRVERINRIQGLVRIIDALGEMMTELGHTNALKSLAETRSMLVQKHYKTLDDLVQKFYDDDYTSIELLNLERTIPDHKLFSVKNHPNYKSVATLILDEIGEE